MEDKNNIDHVKFYYGTTKGSTGHHIHPIGCQISNILSSRLASGVDQEIVHIRLKKGFFSLCHFSDFTLFGCPISLHDDRGGCITVVGCYGRHDLKTMLSIVSDSPLASSIFKEIEEKNNISIRSEDSLF